jgi:hypothetical protein
MSARQTYRSLSGEQKGILKERKVQGSRTVTELIALIEPLALHDEATDNWRWAIGCAAPFAYAATGISAVLTLMIPALGVPLLVFLILSISFTMIRMWLGRFDLSNNLREFALPLFMDLKENVAPGEEIDVALDLRPPTHESKVLTRKKYRGGGAWRVVETHFQDPWLQGTARLFDGSTLHWNVEDLLVELKRYEVRRSHYRRKRSLLAKFKYSKQSVISIRLSLPGRDYEIAGSSGTADVEVEQTYQSINVKVVRKWESETIEAPPLSVLLDAVSEAYRQVRLRSSRAPRSRGDERRRETDGE